MFVELIYNSLLPFGNEYVYGVFFSSRAVDINSLMSLTAILESYNKFIKSTLVQ